jgi:hypothetical protein
VTTLHLDETRRERLIGSLQGFHMERFDEDISAVRAEQIVDFMLGSLAASARGRRRSLPGVRARGGLVPSWPPDRCATRQIEEALGGAENTMRNLNTVERMVAKVGAPPR